MPPILVPKSLLEPLKELADELEVHHKFWYVEEDFPELERKVINFVGQYGKDDTEYREVGALIVDTCCCGGLRPFVKTVNIKYMSAGQIQKNGGRSKWRRVLENRYVDVHDKLGMLRWKVFDCGRDECIEEFYEKYEEEHGGRRFLRTTDVVTWRD